MNDRLDSPSRRGDRTRRNRRRAFAAVCLALACSVCVCRGEALPSVSDVSVERHSDGALAVSYVLSDAPAVVTLEAMANGVGLDDVHLRRLEGDVNKVVEPGERSIVWHARSDWNGYGDSLQLKVNAWRTSSPPDYLSVDLESGDVRYYVSSNALPFAVVSGPYAGIYAESRILMRRVNAANVKWPMGSPSNEAGRNSAQEALHDVTMTNDFYIGVFELSQFQWRAIEGTNLVVSRNAAWVGRDANPVEAVSYDWIRGKFRYWPDAPAADSFLGRLRARFGLDFDLPGEAQWEFAARAGHYVGEWGDGSAMTDENLRRLAWFASISGGYNGSPTYLGTKAPNDWGLYDMAGNCWEWTLDVMKNDITANSRGEIVGPSDRNAAASMVVRGGCYYSALAPCRPAQRGSNWTTDANANGKCGFRLCLTLPGVEASAVPLSAAPESTPYASALSEPFEYDAPVSSAIVATASFALDTRLDSSADSAAGKIDTRPLTGLVLILR